MWCDKTVGMRQILSISGGFGGDEVSDKCFDGVSHHLFGVTVDVP